MYIWIILNVVALILLLKYWGTKNSVWGGLTLGIIVGILWKIFGTEDWYIVVKITTIGILLGFCAELLGKVSHHYFYNKK